MQAARLPARRGEGAQGCGEAATGTLRLPGLTGHLTASAVALRRPVLLPVALERLAAAKQDAHPGVWLHAATAEVSGDLPPGGPGALGEPLL